MGVQEEKEYAFTLLTAKLTPIAYLKFMMIRGNLGDGQKRSIG